MNIVLYEGQYFSKKSHKFVMDLLIFMS